MKKDNKFINKFFNDIISISNLINKDQIEKIVKSLILLRRKEGRIFFIGVGGSAANCSHAVNDFRKLCNIECYSLTDNISEFSARANDEGLDSTFVGSLKVNKLGSNDAIFILSVGGGDLSKKVSINIVEAIKYARKNKIKIFSIIGKKNGYAYKFSNEKLLIANVDNKFVTPYTESFHSIVWHCIVSHPELKINKTKW